ncbi:thioredoxin domain-containing protein [Porphyrobacter sp. GA68]|uniref:DsbA family protein n=1 Tax=Porphyrobacter sp. GA68 TaxID=2883480 RepID=UPI001D187BAC|nr:thioredoxin domain-containing protein [Porphyrobacter sp. GA68]
MLAAVAALTIGIGGAAWAQSTDTKATRTEAGHLIGRSEAPVRLVEFMSYTCPHCGEFARQADNALHLVYAASGKVSVEYRPMIHDGADLTVTMLVDCAGAERFAAAHATFMARQEGWLGRYARTPAMQRQAWSDAPRSAERRRSIASSLDLYPLVEPLGLSRIAADRCLSDQARADKLVAAADQSRADFGVRGTPSFALDGVLLAATHDWNTLRPQIDARLNPGS